MTPRTCWPTTSAGCPFTGTASSHWRRARIDRQGLTQAEFLAPVLDTFLRALPHTLRAAEAPLGAAVEFSVTGPAGGTWICVRTEHGWALHTRPRPQPVATVRLDADTTWRLCTRGVTPTQARAHAVVHGDQALADAALDIVSIIY